MKKTLKFLAVRDVKHPVRANKKDSGYDMFIPNNVEDLYKAETCVFSPKETISEATQNEMKHELFKKDNKIIIPSGFGILIPSGIKLVLPESDEEDTTYDFVFNNKSGVSTKKGLIVGACVVDNEYRGEIHIHIINTSNEDQYIMGGEKIIQGIIRKLNTFDTEELTEEEFNNYSNTDRGAGGFGSSGTK